MTILDSLKSKFTDNYSKYFNSGIIAGSVLTLESNGNPLFVAIGMALGGITGIIAGSLFSSILANTRNQNIRNGPINFSNLTHQQRLIFGGSVGLMSSLPSTKNAMNNLETITNNGFLNSVLTTGVVGFAGVLTLGSAYLTNRLYREYPQERKEILKSLGTGALYGGGISTLLYNLL